MINIPEELKNIYRNDRVPIVPNLAFKELKLYFPLLDLTIETDRVVDDSFSLQENLCSSDDLTLGSCEGSILKITVANLVQDLSGYEFILTQIVNSTYEMPLGTYRIASCKKQNDLWFREIVAYDNMAKTDTDVSVWYNGLTWPQTVKSMRQSLLTHLGLQYEDQTITNDTITLAKTVNPSSLVARDVLKRLCEINAGFGHFTRSGKFKVIQLSGIGLYPSETLYPAEDLFPSESGEYVTAGYESADYEEYIVEPTTSVTIREDDEDVGATSGTPGNPYIITSNFLLYGKSASELQSIVDNILLQVKNKYYRPHNTVMMGLPYMEVGDSVTLITTNDAVESFIFRRTLKGIQSLTDEISATGNQKRNQQVGLNTQIQQLKGKTLRIQKSVDELRIDMTDADAQLATQISVTAGGLQTQITDNYNNLSNTITATAGSLQTQITDNKNDANSQFSQQADAIALRVEKSGVVAAINLTPESVKIAANKVELSGYATFSSLSTPGQTVIDGANLKTGTVTADIVRSSWVYAGNINASQINAGTMSASRISGGTLSGVTIISEYEAFFPSIEVQGTSSITRITGPRVETPACTVAGYDVITAGNRNSFYYDSTRIEPITTGGGNIGLHGLNAASVNWVNANFQPLSPSDFRLKRNYKQLSDLPLSLFYEIKAMQFEFKTNDYGNGVYFGFFAQKIESAFTKHGLNAFDYNIVQLRKVNKYNNEGFYIKDEVHVVNYNNFIAWEWDILQKICEKINLI